MGEMRVIWSDWPPRVANPKLGLGFCQEALEVILPGTAPDESLVVIQQAVSHIPVGHDAL